LTDTVTKTRDGAIVYDTAILNHIEETAFQAAGWAMATAVDGAFRSAGRGNTLVVSDGSNDFVLRHYMRGGLPGKFIRDTYFWTGEDTTRSFAEFRILTKLRKLGLPVPTPVAARYQRRGPFYKADLLTMKLPDVRSLAERILERPGNRQFWRRIGSELHRFHHHGVCHADLNAYNVQVAEDDSIYLLDFDRGQFREAGVWRQKNLARLHRSLQKIKSLDKRVHFSRAEWNELLEGYFSESRSA
jgi:3-deoxy-D-manno-octulosonic acid kinase